MASSGDTLVPDLPGETTGELAGRILDAALEEFLAYGLRRASIDSIARRAGLARATVYRRFGSKNDLTSAVVIRESRRLLVRLVRAVEDLPTVEERLTEAFVHGTREVRDHPLFTTLLRSEPETVLPYLTTDSEFVLGFARAFLAGQFRRSPGPPIKADPDAAAEIVLRLSLSIILAPRGHIPLDTDDDLRTFAGVYLIPLLSAGAR
ncbi:MAG TPA: TetR/AcrR family transcriptional regulator [Streptosporangiaceae bacterium]|jgi:AcrR family transcriptional regulator